MYKICSYVALTKHTVFSNYRFVIVLSIFDTCITTLDVTILQHADMFTTSNHATVKPLIKDPLKSGQPLYHVRASRLASYRIRRPRGGYKDFLCNSR